jgi:hypothetical protein
MGSSNQFNVIVEPIGVATATVPAPPVDVRIEPLIWTPFRAPLAT